MGVVIVRGIVKLYNKSRMDQGYKSNSYLLRHGGQNRVKTVREKGRAIRDKVRKERKTKTVA